MVLEVFFCVFFLNFFSLSGANRPLGFGLKAVKQRQRTQSSAYNTTTLPDGLRHACAHAHKLQDNQHNTTSNIDI